MFFRVLAWLFSQKSTKSRSSKSDPVFDWVVIIIVAGFLSKCNG